MWFRRSRRREWIDVYIDIDDTIVNSGGPLCVPGFSASYRLATGAIEFLVALNRMQNVRVSFYSAGVSVRNRRLVDQITKEIRKRGHGMIKFEVFSVTGGMYGKKGLKNLRKGLNLERAILVDDMGQFADSREERNLLKVYRMLSPEGSYVAKVYMARVQNNLVRALGIILLAFGASEHGQCTVVEAMHKLQWDSHGNYLHETSNTEEVYLRGLEAMRQVNPDFSLVVPEEGVLPWCPVQDKSGDLFHSDIFRDELLNSSRSHNYCAINRCCMYMILDFKGRGGDVLLSIFMHLSFIGVILFKKSFYAH